MTEEEILLRPYAPPALFIFEEVEIGVGHELSLPLYHTLHVALADRERGWSKPYKKTSDVEYRSRVVKVDYPPKQHPECLVRMGLWYCSEHGGCGFKSDCVDCAEEGAAVVQEIARRASL